MPPLGQALMGLWASEAYSFHSVSTSRFPSILFHNTPGDVYVLQDGRKMRSRLHSDIGRFTGRNRAVKRKRERKSERHRRNDRRGKRKGKGGKKPGQSLLERSSWDLRGYPDYFSHRWFAEYPKNRTTVIKREIASVFTYVPYIYIYIRNSILVPPGKRTSKLDVFLQLTWNRKRKRGISRADFKRLSYGTDCHAREHIKRLRNDYSVSSQSVTDRNLVKRALCVLAFYCPSFALRFSPCVSPFFSP